MAAFVTRDAHAVGNDEASIARSPLSVLPPSMGSPSETLPIAPSPARDLTGDGELGRKPRTIATKKARHAIAAVKPEYSTAAVKNPSANMLESHSDRLASFDTRNSSTWSIAPEIEIEIEPTSAGVKTNVHTEVRARQANSSEEETRLASDAAKERAAAAAEAAVTASDEVTLSWAQSHRWKAMSVAESGEAIKARGTAFDATAAQLKQQEIANAAAKELREARMVEREAKVALQQELYVLGPSPYKIREAKKVAQDLSRRASIVKTRLTVTAAAVAGAKVAAAIFAAAATATAAADPAASTPSTATISYTYDTSTMRGVYSEKPSGKVREEEGVREVATSKTAMIIEKKSGAKSLGDNHDQANNADKHDIAMKDAASNGKRPRPITRTKLEPTPRKGSTTTDTFARDSCSALKETKARASKRVKRAESAAVVAELENHRLQAITKHARLRGFTATAMAAHADHEANQAAEDALALQGMAEDAAAVAETEEAASKTAERYAHNRHVYITPPPTRPSYSKLMVALCSIMFVVFTVITRQAYEIIAAHFSVAYRDSSAPWAFDRSLAGRGERLSLRQISRGRDTLGTSGSHLKNVHNRSLGGMTVWTS